MIKTHCELAEHIAGKNILVANSGGKDSVLALEWVSSYASVAKIVSLTYKFIVPHPCDDMYFKYLMRRFPHVEFKFESSPQDISRILLGNFQSPIDILTDWNKTDHFMFDHQEMTENLRVENGCDFVAYGVSRYESFDRACYFDRKGLVDGTQIFPLGNMYKKQVLGLIKSTGIKLHPVYNISKSTLDKPSYYKYRSTFFKYPEFKKAMYEVFPLLELDEYRYERLLHGKD